MVFQENGHTSTPTIHRPSGMQRLLSAEGNLSQSRTQQDRTLPVYPMAKILESEL